MAEEGYVGGLISGSAICF